MGTQRQPTLPPNPEPASDWKFAIRALQHRNYALFFSGQTVSLVGTWMTKVATSWLVYRLTHSAFLLGLVGFAGQIPAFLLGPFAGVWVDRWNRHRVLVVTQTLSMVQSFGLAILALTHRITVWDILALSLFQGAINAFDMPARQAFVIQMVERREDLPNAIALNSSMVNASRLIGPSIAGGIIALAGEGYCFLIDGISHIEVIASLLRDAHHGQAGRESSLAACGRNFPRAGGYVSHFRTHSLLFCFLLSLIKPRWHALHCADADFCSPRFARRTAHAGISDGCIGGSGRANQAQLMLATRKTVLGLGRVIALTAGIFGAALIAFSVLRTCSGFHCS